MHASIGTPAGRAALRAFGVRRALLLTPFDAERNELLREHLAKSGIEAVLPKSPVTKENTDLSPQTAERYTADEVYGIAVEAFRETGGADAVYFQGAPLDPLLVWERLESELGRRDWLASSCNLMGNTLLAESHIEQATEQYELALELTPDDPSVARGMVLDNLGYCRVLQGDPILAITVR